jgi:hypothetical protein
MLASIFASRSFVIMIVILALAAPALRALARGCYFSYILASAARTLPRSGFVQLANGSGPRLSRCGFVPQMGRD